VIRPTGGTTQLREVIVNCTRKAQVVTETAFGTEPCAVLDPVVHQVALARREEVDETSDYVALQCPGRVSITTRLTNVRGKQLAEEAPSFTIVSG
jgi:hypothetical protein